MNPDRFWQGLALGALIAALAVGWGMEHRMLAAAERRHQQEFAGVLADQVVLAEALKLGVPDPLTRALIGAQAVRNTGEKAKESKR